MNLLSKTNPAATPASVRNWAIAVGITYVLLLAGFDFSKNLLPFWPVKILSYSLVFLLGAFVGGLMEWQLDDSDDEELDR